MVTTAGLAEMTDEELAEMVTTFADDEDAIAAILAELECREADDEPTEQDKLIALVDGERRAGESREQAVDRMYGELTYRRYIDAENATAGHLLNKAGLAAGIDPYTLFHGSAKRAVKYASRELRDWWDTNGRMTWIEYKAWMLGRPSDIKLAREVRNRAQALGL